MLPKIIKSGNQIKNFEENYGFPKIGWEELVKNKEERHEKLLLEKKETGEVRDSIKIKENKKKVVEKVKQNDITPKIDIDFIKKEAEKILENANLKKDEIESKAYDLGYSSGYSIGQEEGKREYMEGLSNLAESIANIGNLKEILVREYETEIIKLAISIAEKILKREVKVNSEHIVEIVSSLVTQLKDKSQIKIRVSNEDYKQLSDNKKISDLKYISSDFQIIEDITLKKGDVLIDTSFGIVDASINSQLNRIKDELV